MEITAICQHPRVQTMSANNIHSLKYHFNLLRERIVERMNIFGNMIKHVNMYLPNILPGCL